jgi:hypothetical protein
VKNRFQSLPFKFNLQRYIVGLAGTPPSELWNELELSGSDLYRFDAATMCSLASAVGETVAAAGWPLEALPALAVAEHLAVHALNDATATAHARALQAAALADAGCFTASADRIAALIAGDGLPSTSTGASGKILRNAEDGAVLKRPDSVPPSPGFKATLPIGAAENKPAVGLCTLNQVDP